MARAPIAHILGGSFVALIGASQCQGPGTAAGLPVEAAVRASEHVGSTEAQARLDEALEALLPMHGAGMSARLEAAEFVKRIERPLDFGVVAVVHERAGLEARCGVHLLELEGEPVEAEVRCYGPNDRGAPRRRGRGPAMARFTWPRRAQLVERRRAARLGPIAEVEVPPSLAAEYELLRGTEPLTHGWSCGVGGAEARGRRATEELIAAKRSDLLRNVLRGIDPTHRLYGVEGLVRLGAWTPADQRVIDASRGTTVDRCDGCMPSEPSFVDAVEEVHGYLVMMKRFAALEPPAAR